jgi:Rieske Fe-S protein
MERRDFIQKTCAGCAGFLGLGILASSLEGCAPLPLLKIDSNEKEIQVEESAFVEKQTILILKNYNWDADILLVKKTDKKSKAIQYTALKMQCSHNPNPLTATKSGLNCATHGSTFDLDGQVILQPATQPLKQFNTIVKDKIIVINLN